MKEGLEVEEEDGVVEGEEKIEGLGEVVLNLVAETAWEKRTELEELKGKDQSALLQEGMPDVRYGAMNLILAEAERTDETFMCTTADEREIDVAVVERATGGDQGRVLITIGVGVLIEVEILAGVGVSKMTTKVEKPVGMVMTETT